MYQLAFRSMIYVTKADRKWRDVTIIIDYRIITCFFMFYVQNAACVI